MMEVGFNLIEQTSGTNHPDIALLEFYQKPPFGYNIYYVGWEAYDGEYLDSTEVVGISHPRGGTKKGSNCIVHEKPWPFHKFYAAEWFDGYTDKGSSGSGLFNKNHRIIGVDSWAVLKCKSNYGQLAHFYEDIDKYLGNGCDFERFGHINGADPIWACQENLIITGNMYPAFDWQDKNEIIIQANNQITADGQMTFNKSPINLFPNINYVNYTFRAGDEVVLKPEFTVFAGHNPSNFNNNDCQSVGIEDCYPSNEGMLYVGSDGTPSKPYFSIERFKRITSGSIFNPSTTLRLDKTYFTVDQNGNVGVGLANPTHKFHVIGNALIDGDLIIKGNNPSTNGTTEVKITSQGYIRARDVLVDFEEIPDYVFSKTYKLLPLIELRKYIEVNNHLPNIQSAKEFETKGNLSVSEMNLKLLEKVEELTLYILELEERISKLEK